MNHALFQSWEETLRCHGDQRAVVQAADGRSVTFRKLDERATAWLGAQAVDRKRLRRRPVVFAVRNGIGWFEIFLGLLKAGAVVVPLDMAEPVEEQRRFAESLRAGFWWDGGQLVSLEGPGQIYHPTKCLIKLTSGSTGQPRPLVFTGEQLLADGRQVTATMRIRPSDLNYALIPLGHSYGLGNLVLPLLAHGVPLVCGTTMLPHAVAADFALWKPTVFPGVPAMWRALAASNLVLGSLRLGISAGAPLPPEVAKDFAARFGQRLHSFYGSSETGGIAYDRSGQPTLAGQVGWAMLGVKLTAWSRGRLLVSSAAVMTYGNDRRDGKLGAWVMPDRVKLNARGDLTIIGRAAQTVKIAGRRVNLAEVTERLRRLPGVHDVWVGMGAGNEPVLGAVVATKRTVVALRTALLADTAAWKIPKKLIAVAALPITARGKPDTRALRAMVFADRLN